MANKLVVVGLDGADWRIIEPLMAEGCLPNLKKMYDNGSHARLRSTIPHLTAPSWNSIFTGVNPGKHGIFTFTKPVGKRIEATSSKDNSFPYVWELMEGKKVLAFNIPCSYPPRGIPGDIVVSGFATPEESSSFTYPKNVKDDIMRLAPDYNFSISIAALEAIKEESESNDPIQFQAQGENADKAGESRKSRIAKSILDNLEMKKRVGMHLLESKPWDDAIIVFSAPDWAQHKFMCHFMEEARKGDTEIGRVYRSIDDFLGAILSKGYDIVMVSDHGFEPLHAFYYLNTYLFRKGYLKLKPGNPMKELLMKTGISRERIIKLIPLPIFWRIFKSRFASNLGRSMTHSSCISSEEIDLEKSEAFFLFPGLYVNKKGSIEEVIASLDGCVDADGAKVIQGVIRREDIYHGPMVGKAPDLLPMPVEGVALLSSIRSDPSIPFFRKVKPGQDNEAAHAEYGIFLAYGQSFTAKGRIGDLSVMDITPTILAYYGYELPGHLDGVCAPIFSLRGGAGIKTSAGIRHETRLALKGLARRMANKEGETK